MNVEALKKDDMFDVYVYTPGKEEMSTENLMSVLFAENGNRILKLEQRLDDDIWHRLDKEIAVSGYCVSLKWNGRARPGTVLKRDPETPLFCPRCKDEGKSGLLVLSQEHGFLEERMRSDYPSSMSSYFLAECSCCKRLFSAFLRFSGWEIQHPCHPYRRDLVIR